MAPEIIAGTGYNILADYYSLGSLAYELVVGVPPFRRNGEDKKEMFQNILSNKPTIPSRVSKEGRSFILGLLEKKPQDRLGAKKGFQELIEHKWFAGFDFEAIKSRKVTPPIKIHPKELLIAKPINSPLGGFDETNLEEKLQNTGDFMLSGFSYFSLEDRTTRTEKLGITKIIIGNKSDETKNGEAPTSILRNHKIGGTIKKLNERCSPSNKRDNNQSSFGLQTASSNPKHTDLQKKTGENSASKNFGRQESSNFTDFTEELDLTSPHMDDKMKGYQYQKEIKHMPVMKWIVPSKQDLSTNDSLFTISKKTLSQSKNVTQTIFRLASEDLLPKVQQANEESEPALATAFK